jgi:transposase InsO family protein
MSFSVRHLGNFGHWRQLADYWHISPEAKQRLEWIIFYETVGGKNARETAKYFSISPKTFHKWKRRFNPQRIQSLEEVSRAPKNKREWMVTTLEEQRIINLRKSYIKYGKKKLRVLYNQDFGCDISTWKIERVIRKHKLYPPKLDYKRKYERRTKEPKTRITELKTGYEGTLWHTDAIIIWWYGTRKIIFTALEDKTKVAFARVYLSNSSRIAKDFLERLIYLSDSDIKIIHSDNGSEFAGEFKKECQELRIKQVYSRVRQPKDNPSLERFNRTVQEEWLELSEVGLDDLKEANLDLTHWLIEYNNHRPHQALDYMTPLAYAAKLRVLPMYPASTSS